MRQYIWPLVPWMLEGLNEENYKRIEENHQMNKTSLVVLKNDPFHIVGSLDPVIVPSNGSYGLSGDPLIFDPSINLEETRIARSYIFNFFEISPSSVKLGYTKLLVHIEKDCLQVAFNKYYGLEDPRDKTIKLKNFLAMADCKVHLTGILFKRKPKGLDTFILPFHQFLNERGSVYSILDAYIGRFILKWFHNPDYELSVKFSRDFYQLDKGAYFKKAFWEAPTLESFDDLNETPVAYSYNAKGFDKHLLLTFLMNNPDPLSRVEFYWKQKNQSEWQIEIEQVIDHNMEDYPNYFGMKYFHGIYDQKLNGFVHADISLRIYNQDQFKPRFNDTRLDIQTFGKHQYKVKVFKIDVNLDHLSNCRGNCKTNHGDKIIKIEDIMDLLIIWFKNDPLIEMYFMNVSRRDKEG